MKCRVYFSPKGKSSTFLKLRMGTIDSLVGTLSSVCALDGAARASNA